MQFDTSLKQQDSIINPAQIKWREDDQGNQVPVSKEFGDVYYSLKDGLQESKYVFLQQNKLPKRFKQFIGNAFTINNGDKKTAIADNSERRFTFTIAELGFGTGLNMLATWQLWQTIKRQMQSQLTLHNSSCNSPRNSSHPLVSPRLHLISTELFPLSHKDLKLSLTTWQRHDPSLKPLINKLLSLYPTLIKGCHRLHLSGDVTLDLWLGDALHSLKSMHRSQAGVIDAWYLDGFAPTCNQALWAEDIFKQMRRLSQSSSTFATFSSAGVVKRGLLASGFSIKKVKGFGHKRQMLIGKFAGHNPVFLSSQVLHAKAHQHIRKAKHSLQKNSSNLKTDQVTLYALFNYAIKSNFLLPATDLAIATNINKANSQTSKLCATVNHHNYQQYLTSTTNFQYGLKLNKRLKPLHNIAIVGSGISGLMAAWALAQRGIQITLLDKNAPLSGASGNPRALLAPKMTPITHVAEHLHSTAYLYSQRFYQQLDAETHNVNNGVFNDLTIFKQTGLVDLLIKANVDAEKIAQYPKDMACVLDLETAQTLTGLTHAGLQTNLFLPQAGLINPKILADTIIAHPNIKFIEAKVSHLSAKASIDSKSKTGVELTLRSNDLNPSHYINLKLNKNMHIASTLNLQHCLFKSFESNQSKIFVDTVIIAAAYESHRIDSRIFDFRKIRGQLSWFEPTDEQLQALSKLPLKYNGYCALFNPNTGDNLLNPVATDKPTLLLGASFIRNDTDKQIRDAEHQINKDKLITAIPELKAVFESNDEQFNGWQARVGIRAQTPDYHPLIGQIDDDGLIWTISGMGSKGYAYAPLCAEVLADKIFNNVVALPTSVVKKLCPKRKRLNTKLDSH